jgi:D-alanyl-lipoteichoic acid acyltransferase DltB (MBOAT superfamily)
MAIGYTVDVYNEEIEAEKNLGILALFISFFPLILSGPIERAKNMLPQFREQKKFDYNVAVQGFKLMLWGYFLKLVVADRVGIYVDAIYNNIGQHNGTTLLFASLLYPFQVYADLGGYSLIAIGTAKVLGINVMFNFNRPFFSTSIAEFWRRWHISLITWLTDYVYTPLAFHFRTLRIWGIVLALMITFLISGIWHGANLTFIVWGLMQGFFLSLEALTTNTKTKIEGKFKLKEKSIYILVSCIITYVIFASSQIFGRATSINDAFTVFRKIATSSGHIFIGELQQLVYGVLAVGFLIVIEFRQEFFTKSQDPLKFNKWYFEHLGYALLVILILLVGVFDGSQFIYFQF